MKVIVPWPDVVAPPEVFLVTYDGQDPAPAGVEDAEMYVLPLTSSPVPLRLIPRLPRPRVLQTLTAGYDHLRPHVPEDVVLCSGGGIHASSVSELAVALILSSLRGIPQFVRAQDDRSWAHTERPALADKTVLIIGRGAIGSALAARLAPFECTVLLVGRSGAPCLADLPALLPSVDVVVLCVPLNDSTRGMVDADFLRRLPDGALLVNVARGAVVDTGALSAELRAGRLHAALDVTDPEPPPPDSPLWQLPNLLITPHVGGPSTAFHPRAKRLVAEQLRRAVAADPLLNQVDLA
jgi:phosphoglycerate dehydrogenase-like enzyme